MEFLELVKTGDLEAVQKFLETSNDLAAINAWDQDGWTSLHWAAVNEQSEVVQLLLTSSKLTEASINAQTKYGETALHEAAYHGKMEVVQLLLTSSKFVNGNLTEASINSQTKYGWTALHVATYRGQTEVVQLLLTSPKFVNGNLTKAFINTQSKNGWTALHFAARYGHIETIAYMLKTEDFEAHLHVLQFDLDLINHQGRKAEDLTNDPKIKALFQKYREAQSQAQDLNQLAYDLTKRALN